jgi:FkbM family methyltransferase
MVKAIKNQEVKLSHPLVVVDVGAAQAFDPRWEQFGEICTQIGFEPDRDECERLKKIYSAQDKGLSNKILEATALWHSKETRILNVTRDPDATSFYKPNANFFRRLPDPTLQEVVATFSIDAIPLDEYSLPIDGTIDAIKLDVQAAELDVMRGAQRHMDDGVLVVIAELLFTPHYIDQPWFGDFDAFMRSHGYQVFDIDLRRWRRRHLPSQFDGVRVGGISYGDAVYFKDPVAFEQREISSIDPERHFCKPSLERDKLLKLIALAEFFSVPDYAIEVAEYGVRKGVFTDSEFEQFVVKLKSNQIIQWNDRNNMPL